MTTDSMIKTVGLEVVQIHRSWVHTHNMAVSTIIQTTTYISSSGVTSAGSFQAISTRMLSTMVRKMYDQCQMSLKQEQMPCTNEMYTLINMLQGRVWCTTILQNRVSVMTLFAIERYVALHPPSVQEHPCIPAAFQGILSKEMWTGSASHEP